MSLTNNWLHEFLAYFNTTQSDFQGYLNHDINNINNIAFIPLTIPIYYIIFFNITPINY
jgi:hypothetical protein